MLATFFFVLGFIIYHGRRVIRLEDIDGPEELIVKCIAAFFFWGVGLFLMGYAFWLWGWRIVKL